MLGKVTYLGSILHFWVFWPQQSCFRFVFVRELAHELVRELVLVLMKHIEARFLKLHFHCLTMLTVPSSSWVEQMISK